MNLSLFLWFDGLQLPGNNCSSYLIMADTVLREYSVVDCRYSGLHGQSHLCLVFSDIDSACEKSSFIVLKESNDEHTIGKVLKIKVKRNECKMNQPNALSVCSCADSVPLSSTKEHHQSSSTSSQNNVDVNSNRKTVLSYFIDQDKLVKLVRRHLGHFCLL